MKSKLRLATNLLTMLNMKANLEKLALKVVNAMLVGLSDTDISLFNKYFRNEYLPKQFNGICQIYSESFTTQELNDLIKMFKSTVGQVYLTKQPFIKQQVEQLTTQLDESARKQLLELFEAQTNEPVAT